MATFHIMVLVVLVSCMQTSPESAFSVEPAAESALPMVTITPVTEPEVLSTAEVRSTTYIPGISTMTVVGTPLVSTPTTPGVTAGAAAGTNTPGQTSPETPALGDVASFTVSGYVLRGGDTTPPGLLDAPRTFIYEVQQEDGSVVNVSFISYPPSPVGDRQSITLDFYAGFIRPGDYLIARGTFETVANTLSVTGEGDYITTYPQKPG
jgi:hypothetical protein